MRGENQRLSYKAYSPGHKVCFKQQRDIITFVFQKDESGYQEETTGGNRTVSRKMVALIQEEAGEARPVADESKVMYLMVNQPESPGERCFIHSYLRQRRWLLPRTFLPLVLG